MTATTHQPVDSQNKRGLFQQLELDVRLLGMIGAFIILCIDICTIFKQKYNSVFMAICGCCIDQCSSAII